MPRLHPFSLLCSLTILLTACDGDSSIQTGVFLDSAVTGATYRTSSGLNGITDAQGRFDYRAGDTVTFSVGGIDLPAAKAAAKVTPLDLVGATHAGDSRAIAIARLLQSVDDDGDPDNGIRIDTNKLASGARAPADWSSSTDLTTLLAAGVTPRTEAQARQHLARTIASISSDPRLKLVGRHAPALGEGVAEIVAYHAASRSAFMTVDVVDTDDAELKSSFRRIPMAGLTGASLADPTIANNLEAAEITLVAGDVNDAGFTAGGVQSLDVHGNLLAIAVRAATKTDPGVVAFYSLDATGKASYRGKVSVGALPDGLAFSPDGKWLVVANEGELSDDFLDDGIDPEGSISVIAVTNGVPAEASSTLNFAEFNVGGTRHAELPSGLRIGRPGASIAQDLEPEFVTVDEDSRKAYVSLQENNGIAVVDLSGPTPRLESILALGFKDHGLSRNALAASDRYAGKDAVTTNVPTLTSYANVFGVYMPDSIAAFTVAGRTYLLTANEGDDRNDFLFNEDEEKGEEETARVGKLKLDPTAFPNAEALQADAVLGRLTVMAQHAGGRYGDTDGDGDYDRLFALGGRSFSIVDATSGAEVFDSGDDLERLVYQSIDDETDAARRLALIQAKQVLERLDNKGPEPEGVVTGRVGDQLYAFVGMERSSAIAMFRITDPAAPVFVQMVRNSTNLKDGDISPEGLKFVPADVSPTGKALLLVGHEVSGSLAVYQLD
jgi:hypothetical protein